jgi:hypothetical protein
MKDPTIQELLKKLRGHFGQELFQIVDHWEADLRAIGITRPDSPAELVYVSTFDLPEGRYYVSLERHARPESHLPYECAGTYQDIDFQ